MPNRSFRPAQKLRHALTDAWTSWRERQSRVAELDRCDPDELERVAYDLGLAVGTLRTLAEQAPDSADLVDRRIAALGLDREAIIRDTPAVMRDLQRCCSGCGVKARCASELDAKVTRGDWRDYCPNSATLTSLKVATER